MYEAPSHHPNPMSYAAGGLAVILLEVEADGGASDVSVSTRCSEGLALSNGGGGERMPPPPPPGLAEGSLSNSNDVSVSADADEGGTFDVLS